MGEDKIIIITGANSGIGKASTHIFAKDGHTVVMACRNVERSRRIQEEVKKKSSNSRVDLMQLDVSSIASIRQFCTLFKEKYNRLDILIHNAAYVNHGSTYRLIPDNIELTLATNTLGPYVMTDLLLGHLQKSSDARIIHASSSIIKHFFNPKREIHFDRLIGEMGNIKGFSVYDMYCQSKMTLMLLTFKMAEEYKKYGIKVHALQINGSKMSKETLQKFTLKWRLIAKIQNLYFPPTEKMANIYYNMSTSEEFSNLTGKLMNDKMEIMERGVENPSLLTVVKQVRGTKFYSTYADQEENQKSCGTYAYVLQKVIQM